jgi:hypothetical protein
LYTCGKSAIPVISDIPFQGDGSMINAVFIVMGFVILITGYQLPWLFVACVGFIAGYTLGQVPLIGLSGIALITFSSGFAIIGGLLVLYIRRIMLVLAGFLAGVYICQYLLPSLGWNSEWISWFVLVIAGLFAAAIIFIWQSLALIFISSLAGATLVIHYIQIVRIPQVLLFVILFLFGITAQWLLLQYSKSEGE